MNALDWEVDLECKQHCFFFSFFSAFLSSQTIIKRECQKVNFRREKKCLLCLMNVNFLIFLVCFSFKLFLYQHHPGRLCQVTRLWEISHGTNSPHFTQGDLRGAEGLAQPPHPGFLGALALQDSFTVLPTLEDRGRNFWRMLYRNPFNLGLREAEWNLSVCVCVLSGGDFMRKAN